MPNAPYFLFADDRRQLGEPRRARRDAFLDLDHVDDIQAEAPREIRPGIVIGDEARAAMRGEKPFPLHETCLEAREKTIAVVDELSGHFGRETNTRLGNSTADRLGIGGNEPGKGICEAGSAGKAPGGVAARSP